MAESGTVSTVLDEQSAIALVEFSRPPFNYFDASLVAAIADAYDGLAQGGVCRAIVLCATGRHFCAGADFSDPEWSLSAMNTTALYTQALRLFACPLPVVAAVQGRAIGGGLGLALSADFRVAAPGAVFVCNFARLGIHHGFGITVTLPAVIGPQRALDLLYTGGALDARAALEAGLCEAIDDDPREGALRVAARIAAAAPLAVRAIKDTMRAPILDRLRDATAAESAAQARLSATADFIEGVAAARERRPPRFIGS
jgi:2-(1,2-epoxy-1,2-dihydrophenyl)acetyl-CoA isomerase